ncbi:hypothetical protein MMC21_007881 [Puttea exsequens]|nr:hypothetical protein [Puttea exsequens]
MLSGTAVPPGLANHLGTGAEFLTALPTAFALPTKVPPVEVTATAANGDLILEEIEVVTHVSPLVTYPLSHQSSSRLRDSRGPSTNAGSFLASLTNCSYCPSFSTDGEATSRGALVSQTPTSTTNDADDPPAAPPYALTLDLDGDFLTKPATQLAAGIPILLKVDRAGSTTRVAARSSLAIFPTNHSDHIGSSSNVRGPSATGSSGSNAQWKLNSTLANQYLPFTGDACSKKDFKTVIYIACLLIAIYLA